MNNNKKREETALGRFEEMCERYINGTEETRAVILSFLNDEEKQTFFMGCGLYHLFTDSTFYKVVETTLAEEFWKEANAENEKILD